jgi:hypothetical protein
MSFCPECSAEYTSDVLICADCQVELVPEPLSEDAPEYIDWEVVQEIPSEFVGNLIKGVLEGEGIDAVVRPHEISALGGIRLESEWGEILVLSDQVQNAKMVIEDYLANLPADALENGDEDIV